LALLTLAACGGAKAASAPTVPITAKPDASVAPTTSARR
jgi:hypothetical protein